MPIGGWGTRLILIFPISADHEDNHFEVCDYLRQMKDRDVKQLGGALGLGPARLNKMKDFPGSYLYLWILLESV